MKAKTLKLTPVFIALGLMVVIWVLQSLPRLYPGLEGLERLEWMTYDWRVRLALKHHAPFATNQLAAVFIDDESTQTANELFRFRFPPWPRQMYGCILHELTAEKAKAVGFDILFDELDVASTNTDFELPGGALIHSDDLFARELKQNGTAVLAVMGEENQAKQWNATYPAPLFRTNAMDVAHVTAEKDDDGVMRRARPFRLDAQGKRVWHLGITLAAKALEIDLAQAELKPDAVILRGREGLIRTIPLERDGTFYIDWALTWNSTHLTYLGAYLTRDLGVLRMDGNQREIDRYFAQIRSEKPGITNDHPFRDKIVVIGSKAQGSNASDIGATPLDRGSYLVSKHWNVANSILTGQFIHRSSLGLEMLVAGLLGLAVAGITWKSRALAATVWVAFLGLLYLGVAIYCYVCHRLWIPLFGPIIGSVGFTYVGVVSYQAIFEQNERKRVKSVFSRIVSPNVVNELLSTETLSLGGARRDVTVYFADVRGFTEMTDLMQSRAEEYVRENKLDNTAAEAYYDEQARETLATVNRYLGAIADKVKQHNGTLDKYIGDCVMAFWGAPTPNEQHALGCVRAAIDAQRSIYSLNLERMQENKRREVENLTRKAAGQLLRELLPILSLGSGINTGMVTVGLMGSDAHILNYTVFGREVNLASRLEGVSGRGRIVIGERTYRDLQKWDPALAAQCLVLDPVTPKGFRQAQNIFEVPWKTVADPAGETSSVGHAPALTVS